MGTVVAERVDRPLSLFDELESLAPAALPERERAIPEKSEPAAPVTGESARGGVVAPDGATAREGAAAPGGAVVWEDAATQDGATTPSGEAADGGAAQVRGGVGGEPTLDELIVGAWEGLTAQAVAACPVCDAGGLRPIYADAGGASPPVAGRCTSCGTTLS